MIYTQNQAKAFHAENTKLRAAANMPPRKPIVGCIGQKAIREIVTENSKLSGESKTPILDNLAKFHAEHGRPPEGAELLALAAAAPVAAASPTTPTVVPALPGETLMGKKMRLAHEQSAASRPAKAQPATGKTLTKAEFDQLSPQAKHEHFRNGGKLC